MGKYVSCFRCCNTYFLTTKSRKSCYNLHSALATYHIASIFIFRCCCQTRILFYLALELKTKNTLARLLTYLLANGELVYILCITFLFFLARNRNNWYLHLVKIFEKRRRANECVCNTCSHLRSNMLQEVKEQWLLKTYRFLKYAFPTHTQASSCSRYERCLQYGTVIKKLFVEKSFFGLLARQSSLHRFMPTQCHENVTCLPCSSI